jgi:uncharacterized protein YndB with AHSA1/START domain
MFVPILAGAGAVIAGILGYAATRPGQFRVARSARIDAPPERVYEKVNDFHHWPSWSPWEELDPSMTKTHSGAPSGKGAVYEWKGNKKVGRGRMEITDSEPSRRIAMKLDFFEPFEAHNTVELTLVAGGNGTDVTWAMSGTNPFLMKVIGVFMNMDKMVGKDFEKGLARLKGLVES